MQEVRLNYPRDPLCASESMCFCCQMDSFGAVCSGRIPTSTWTADLTSCSTRLAGSGAIASCFIAWVMAREIMTQRVNLVENGPQRDGFGQGGNDQHSHGAVCPRMGLMHGDSTGREAALPGSIPHTGAALVSWFPSHHSLFVRSAVSGR